MMRTTLPRSTRTRALLRQRSQQERAQSEGLGAFDDRGAEDDVRQPDTEVRRHDPTARRPFRPGQDGLAEGRRGVGVVIEEARIPVREELAAVVDQEERRVARDVRCEIRRVVDRHHERIRCQPVAGHDLTDRTERRRGHDDVRVADGRARVRRDGDVADPIGGTRRRQQARPSDPGVGRRRSAATPGRRRPRTARWLWPWIPAPMSAARGARPVTTGAKWRIATPEMAAVRTAVIGPPSRIAAGAPVAASLMTTRALIAGSPRALFVANPDTHLIPIRSPVPPGVGAAEIRRHGVDERVSWSRVDADLRRQLGIGDEGDHRLLGQRQALVDVGHGGEDIGGREVAKPGIGRRRGWHARESTRRRWPTMARCPRSTSSRASTT